MADFNVSYPGILQPSRGAYTVSHDENPAICVIECVSQTSSPDSHGDVVFTAPGGGFVLRGCRLRGGSYRNDPQGGPILSVEIMDRRWRWAFGATYGHYNQRLADGTIRSGTEMTPQELAALLFRAMGEVGWSVSEMPDDLRPEVRWDGDAPARALSDLANRTGCRLVFDPISNTASVRRLGVGAELPDGFDVMANSGSIDPPNRPDFVRAQLGDTVVEATLILQAVGLDVDGEWRPIDQLSYRPAGGWGRQPIGQFTGVRAGGIAQAGALATVSPRDLAIETIWRNYQVSAILGTNSTRALKSALGTEFDFRFDGWWQLLPLRNELVSVDELTNRPLQAFIQGVFRHKSGGWINSAPWTKFDEPFNLIGDIGIVQFDSSVYKWSIPGSPAASYAPANLYLTCAFNVRQQNTSIPHKYAVDLTLGGPRYNTGPFVTRSDDLFYTVILNYNAAANVASVTTNQADVDREGRSVCLGAAQQFQAKTPYDVQYAGLRPIRPDGAIQQVSWELEVGRGAFTRASRNNEYRLTLPSYQERQALAGVRRAGVNDTLLRLAESVNRRRRDRK